MTHELKIFPKYYEDILSRNKNFELRKDDRNYQVGDLITFREWTGKKYTGAEIRNVPIVYILRNAEEYGLKKGYCILGLYC